MSKSLAKGVKLCPACMEPKDMETGFHKNRTKYDGVSSQCKACRAAVRRISTKKRSIIPNYDKSIREGSLSEVKFLLTCELYEGFRVASRIVKMAEQEAFYRLVQKFTKSIIGDAPHE